MNHSHRCLGSNAWESLRARISENLVPGILCELVVNACSVIWHPGRTDKVLGARSQEILGCGKEMCIPCAPVGQQAANTTVPRVCSPTDLQAALAVTSAFPLAPSLHAKLSPQLWALRLGSIFGSLTPQMFSSQYVGPCRKIIPVLPQGTSLSYLRCPKGKLWTHRDSCSKVQPWSCET